jgi:hypothetical protein
MAGSMRRGSTATIEHRSAPEDIVMQDEIRPRTKPLLWGAFFIVLGGALLFQRFFGLDTEIWDLWPIVFLIIGTSHLFDRRPGSAATMYAFGFWFFAVTFGWFGMTYRNSWPLALIAVGIGAVIRAISGEESSRRSMHRRRREAREARDAGLADPSAPDVRTEEPR